MRDIYDQRLTLVETGFSAEYKKELLEIVNTVNALHPFVFEPVPSIR